MEKVTRCDLNKLDRPGRYVGCEYGQIIKKSNQVTCNIALCYPDLYENGMSDPLFQKLYIDLNSDSNLYCQRAFAPDADFESLIRERGEKLFSLDAKEYLNTFDIIIFIVNSPLLYTNMVNMIDLASLSIMKKDREDNSPKIIAITKNMISTKAISPFIDKFFSADTDRWQLGLQKYIEKYINKEKRYGLEQITLDIKESYINTLVSSISITNSCIQITDNMLENKKSEEILEIIKENILIRGINKVSFILPKEVNEARFCKLVFLIKEKIPGVRLILNGLDLLSISETGIISILPCFEKSMARFNIVSMNNKIRERYSINLSKESIKSKILSLFKIGYYGIGLDFTIGFLDESYEDLDEIINLAEYIIDEFSQNKAKEKIKIDIGISNYIHGEEEQKLSYILLSKLETKQKYLLDKETSNRITINLSNPQISLVSEILATGTDKTCEAIFEAWKQGARFDYNEKTFKKDVWDDVIINRKLL